MIEFTLYNPQDGSILWNGVTTDEHSLPDIPTEYAGHKFAFGVRGNPETQRLETEQVDGQVRYKLVSWTPPATTGDVNAERDRRLAQGFLFSGRRFTADMNVIPGFIASATAAVLNGTTEDGDLRWADPDADFGMIAMDNSVLTMDARTMILFGQTAMAFRNAHARAARVIKDRMIAGETLDVTDDSLWPDQTA